MKYFFFTEGGRAMDYPGAARAGGCADIISFKNKLKQIRETRMGFLWITAKPYEPHLWLDHR